LRLWSLHPKHLDAQGLTAAWREALLAQAVLAGMTRGYKNHPQLNRFKSHPKPRCAIAAFLLAICREAQARGYQFDASKVGRPARATPIRVTRGQVEYEGKWLLKKLAKRSPKDHRRFKTAKMAVHPLFKVVPGPVEPWEKIT
jgi:hypothetical protein